MQEPERDLRILPAPGPPLHLSLPPSILGPPPPPPPPPPALTTAATRTFQLALGSGGGGREAIKQRAGYWSAADRPERDLCILSPLPLPGAGLSPPSPPPAPPRPPSAAAWHAATARAGQYIHFACTQGHAPQHLFQDPSLSQPGYQMRRP